MKRWIPFLLILLLVSCTQPIASQTETSSDQASLSYGDITGEQLESLIGQTEVQIVDVRSPEEFAAGHVEGAINIPVEQFQTQFEDLKLDPEQAIAIYCRSSNRSSVVYQILTKAGFDKVYHAPGVANYSYNLVK